MQEPIKPETRQYLDGVSRLAETMGYGGHFGRILGWLLICEPACQTSDEIAAATGCDPAVATTALETLAAVAVLDRIPLPGGDQVGFALTPLEEMMGRRLQQLAEVRQALAPGLSLVQGEPHERLARFHDFYATLERELPVIMVHALPRREKRRGARHAR